MTEYRLTPAAECDLENIWIYSAQTWSVEQANRYIDILTKAFEQLAQQPRIAPACNEIRTGYRHYCLERNTLYFRIVPYGMEIVRILHDRMDRLLIL
ncbi:type II toxin-antitoxin system RelE/ParE family toxin [Pseudomonas pergaminensis]